MKSAPATNDVKNVKRLPSRASAKHGGTEGPRVFALRLKTNLSPRYAHELKSTIEFEVSK